MCRKSEVDWSLIKFVTSFYRGIQCDKTCYFVHDEAFEVQHEMPFLGVELKKTHKIYSECSISIKFLQYVTEVVFLMIV